MIATRHELAKLTAARLVNLRSTRYRSDEQAIELAQLSPTDRDGAVTLYGTLSHLSTLLLARSDPGGSEPLREFARTVDTTDLIRRMQQLGNGEYEERVAQALHDIRGGTLSACLILLRRVTTTNAPDAGHELAYMTRDHLKIMRNVIADLDVPARRHDLQLAPHSLAKLTSGLSAYAGTVDGEVMRVKLDVDVDEASAPPVIAESCTELGAVDRVAYNLLGNAARFAAEPVVEVWLTVLPTDLRIAVTNLVRREQQRAVRAALAEDRAALFGGFTTGGTGRGLRIAAELVGRAYGVASSEALRDGGYFGAKLAGDTFVSWFHWPLARDSSRPPKPFSSAR